MMTIENKDVKQIIYQESGNFVRQHESMLFQRLNYYLVAIAFLAAGFVELAATSTQPAANTLLTWLAVLVGVTGFFISWFFTAINYLNGQTLTMAYKYAELLEKKLIRENPSLSETELLYRHINYEIFESGKYKVNHKTFIYDSIIASIRFRYNYHGGEPRAPHTWTIPCFFIAFWLIALSIYCRFVFSWWTPFIIIGIPVLLVVIYYCLFHENVRIERVTLPKDVKANPDIRYPISFTLMNKESFDTTVTWQVFTSALGNDNNDNSNSVPVNIDSGSVTVPGNRSVEVKNNYSYPSAESILVIYKIFYKGNQIDGWSGVLNVLPT
jgi:hypothetical protein